MTRLLITSAILLCGSFAFAKPSADAHFFFFDSIAIDFESKSEPSGEEMVKLANDRCKDMVDTAISIGGANLKEGQTIRPVATDLAFTTYFMEDHRERWQQAVLEHINKIESRASKTQVFTELTNDGRVGLETKTVSLDEYRKRLRDGLENTPMPDHNLYATIIIGMCMIEIPEGF